MPARPFEADEADLRLCIRLTPRGGRDELGGVDILADGRAVLKARVRAAPEKGAANRALVALVAMALDVPKSAVSLVAGGTGRLKTLRISGSSERLIAAMERFLATERR